MNQNQEPPKDRFCDLVMKGGITSGVVYPKAIALLSRHYRFKSIGGTSAGAIAAVVAAAAEYQRRQTGSRAGFDLLEKLPDELAQDVGNGNRKLVSLFQPQRKTRRLFWVLIGSLNRSGTSSRIFNIVLRVLVAYWTATVVSVVLAIAIGIAGVSWYFALLTMLVLLIVTVGSLVYVDVTRGLVANGFGLCTGMTEGEKNVALTPWLHDRIQKAAGRSFSDAPLTFGDLWKAEGFPPEWLTVSDSANVRSIDLQVLSTNLAHGRPYVFPLPEDDGANSRFRHRERLFFTRTEMERCLPRVVVDWMEKMARPYLSEPGRTTEILELPEPKHFPVLLAARMSLSFPLLFTAVPLHAIDDDIPGGPRFRRCWFSDGGISSNFPMHLFDGLVPIWPTFGINLEPISDDLISKGMPLVYLPNKYEAGYGERWDRFAEDKGSKSSSALGGFIIAIFGAMQNWNDNALARMPGFRDRVARVRLRPGEGGINLNMEPLLIQTIAQRGLEAAELLVKRFSENTGNGDQAPGWDEHRFVRFHILLKMIEARIPGVREALNPNCPHATNFETLYKNYLEATDHDGNREIPPGYETLITDQECVGFKAAIYALRRLAMPNAKFSFKPIPNPELRVRPPL